MKNIRINNFSELFTVISEINKQTSSIFVFRGEKTNHQKGALTPLIYRGYIENEDLIYRESQRFNDEEFKADKTTFDKLSRVQHYNAPTRLLDVSEDLFSAIYFAIAEKTVGKKNCYERLDKDDHSKDAVIYVLEIPKAKVRYYDSDTVSVLANLAKIPLNNSKKAKSKFHLLKDAKKYKNKGKIKAFNKRKSVKFLRHEIREEKPQFTKIIEPEHIMSVQFVLPKLSSNRVKSQKGAFLLFGLNPDNYEKPIRLLNDDGSLNENTMNLHPIISSYKINLNYHCIEEMKKELEKIGITKPFIYPEIDKVSEHLKSIYHFNNGNSK